MLIRSSALAGALLMGGCALDPTPAVGADTSEVRKGRPAHKKAPAAAPRDETDSPASSDPRNQARWESLLDFTRAQIESDRTPGAGLAIVLDGKLAFFGGVGVKSQSHGGPVSGTTLFRVGSMSKMITAATMLSLSDEGRIRLTDEVIDHVPDFALRAPADPGSITLDQLLFHTAALPDQFDWACPTGPGELRRWFQTHTDYPLWAPPGTFFNYSNIGYSLAGLVAETAGRTPFARLVKERVFDRAGMSTATFDVTAASALDHANLHPLHDEDGADFHEHEITDFDCAAGAPAGNVIASPVDWAHFAETLLAQGGGMLRPETADSMLTGQVPALGTIDGVQFGEDGSYGFGLLVHRDYHGVGVVEHGGGYLGSFSAFWMVPSRRFAAVCLSNGEGNPSAYCAKAADLFLELADTPPAVSLPDEARLALYAGEYEDPNGNLGTVTVTAEGGTLAIDVSAWSASGRATALGASEFALPIDSGDLVAEFFPDDGTPPKFFVSRSGVAVRR